MIVCLARVQWALSQALRFAEQKRQPLDCLSPASFLAVSLPCVVLASSSFSVVPCVALHIPARVAQSQLPLRSAPAASASACRDAVDPYALRPFVVLPRATVERDCVDSPLVIPLAPAVAAVVASPLAVHESHPARPSQPARPLSLSPVSPCSSSSVAAWAPWARSIGDRARQEERGVLPMRKGWWYRSSAA